MKNSLRIFLLTLQKTKLSMQIHEWPYHAYALQVLIFFFGCLCSFQRATQFLIVFPMYVLPQEH